jgi:hypothetical protein
MISFLPVLSSLFSIAALVVPRFLTPMTFACWNVLNIHGFNEYQHISNIVKEENMNELNKRAIMALNRS